MKSETFTIKEVGELLDIEQYVLRYYEKELKLNVLRNSQGHRMYTIENVELLRHIKELREQGFELKAIKNLVANLEEEEGLESFMQISATTTKVGALQVAKEASIDIGNKDDIKVNQFASLMKDMLKEALVEYNEDAKAQLKDELSEEVGVMVNKKFMELEVVQKQKDEEYYKKLDETMREMQKMKKELAEIEDVSAKAKISIWKKIFGEREKNKEIDLQQ
ncbi:MAG: helix-turn-helix domain-containing protein [Cellulosilyticaceae bacterium]